MNWDEAERIHMLNAALSRQPQPYRRSNNNDNNTISMGWAIFWTVVCFPIAIIYCVVKIANKKV
jgi:hypothetical protein